MDPGYQYIRQGFVDDGDNILTSLNTILEKNIVIEDIKKFKNTAVAKQENWDIDINPYIQSIHTIDPHRLIRILEELYECKIFIFERKEKISRSKSKNRKLPLLLIPNYAKFTNYYTWNLEQYKDVVILLSHFGSETENINVPYYEIIYRADWISNKNETYKFNKDSHIVKKIIQFI